MKILIDNGHGIDTPGKRSPDGLFREYAYNREIAARIVSRLTELRLDAQLLTPELEDISLLERVKRERAISAALGPENVILVSIHVNAAASDGKWHNATGWSAYTTHGITRADTLARCLYSAAERNLPGQRIRKFNGDTDPDFEADFFILRHSSCPAVLTESMFMDNWTDLQFLQSPEGKNALTQLHVEGILEFLKVNDIGA